MTRTTRIKGTESPIPGALLKGGLLSIGITIAGAALMSLLIVREVLKESAIGYSAMAVLLAASFLGALTSMKTAKKRLAVVSMLSAVVYFLILIGGNALFYRGEYAGSGATGLVILAGAGSALLLCLKPKKLPRASGRKIRVR